MLAFWLLCQGSVRSCAWITRGIDLSIIAKCVDVQDLRPAGRASGVEVLDTPQARAQMQPRKKNAARMEANATEKRLYAEQFSFAKRAEIKESVTGKCYL